MNHKKFPGRKFHGSANGFDIGVSIKSTLNEILDNQLPPLILCTYSKSLHDFLVKLRITREKKLIINLMYLHQSYIKRETAEVRWIEGGSDTVDAKTKEKLCHVLEEHIGSISISVKPNQWVERYRNI